MCTSARVRHMLAALSTQCTPCTESPLSLRLWRGGGVGSQQAAQVLRPRRLQSPPPGAVACWLVTLGMSWVLNQGVLKDPGPCARAKSFRTSLPHSENKVPQLVWEEGTHCFHLSGSASWFEKLPPFSSHFTNGETEAQRH